LRTGYKLGIAVALVLAGSMWYYVQNAYLGHQLAEEAAHHSPSGIFSDLYPRWLGTRELLLHRRNPYSPEVTREIQIGYYGRPLDANRPGDPKDQAGFAYPLYVVFLLAPATTLRFPVVRLGFRWFLILLTGWSVPLWLRTLQWRAPFAVSTILAALTLGSFPVVQGVELEQLSLLVSGMIAACVFLVVRGRLWQAGCLLALATIKPHLVLLMAAWLLLWALGNLGARQRLLWGFGLTMMALLGGAEWFLPGWMRQFVAAMAAYRRYTGRSGSVLAFVTTSGWGLALSVVILLALAIVCWRARHAPAGTPRFAFVCSLVLTVTIVVIPTTAVYNQVLLLPAVLLLVRHAVAAWGKDRITRLIWSVAGSLLVWPWLAALGLGLAPLFVPLAAVQKAWGLPIYTSLAFPPVLLILLMYTYHEFSGLSPAAKSPAPAATGRASWRSSAC